MRVVILKNAEEVSRRAAEIIAGLVKRRPTAVLGLATGSTPLATYGQLIELHRSGQLSFAGVTTFNLDEYVGLPPSHPQSYNFFMHNHLFRHVDISSDRCHVPSGLADNYYEYGRQYEQAIQNAGGIDLQLLGIGSDGHIAFNEPGSSLASRTRLKALTEETRRDNSRFFDSLDEVPKLAVTMGVGTILEARHILLLATGANKAGAVRSFVEGPVTSQITASALQLHPWVTVILDEPAADWLERRQYYVEVEAAQRELETKNQRYYPVTFGTKD
ncbi:MAG: glucosamine-6-phosphate deaminase [Pirellulaceae bacterium]|nr:glucosamine-6-phosphate deaminase [Pirellulaceae bacterium]